MILPFWSQLIGAGLSNHLKHPITVLPQYFEMDLGKKKTVYISLMEDVVKWEIPKQSVNSPIHCQVEKAGV